MSTALDQRPDLAGGGHGGIVARRAMIRWAWRLFRREWRQQVLVVALLTVAVAATILGVAVAASAPADLSAATLGTANSGLSLPGTDPHLAADIAAIKKQYAAGPVDVIENETVAVPSLRPHGGEDDPLSRRVQPGRPGGRAGVHAGRPTRRSPGSGGRALGTPPGGPGRGSPSARAVTPRARSWHDEYGSGAGLEDAVRVDVSAEAGEYVRGRGGKLWVWAARPRVCCWGTPAYMHAATVPPPGWPGFNPVHAEGLEVWFRGPAGRMPDVLEIGLRGRRHPRVDAYWDSCSFAW